MTANLASRIAFTLLFTSTLLGVAQVPTINLVTLTDTVPSYDLRQVSSVLIDLSRDLSIDEVISAENQSRFQALTTENAIPKQQEAAYWYRIMLRNRSSKTEWRLFAESTLIEEFSVFYRDPDGAFESQHAGLLIRALEQDNETRYPALSLSIKEEAVKEIYLRVTGATRQSVQFTLTERKRFERFRAIDISIFSLSYGIALALIAYHLFLYYRTKAPRYKYYVLYIICTSLATIVYEGFANTLIRSTLQFTPQTIWLIFNALVAFALFAKLQFCRHILRLETWARQWDRFVGIGSLWIFVAFLASSVLDRRSHLSLQAVFITLILVVLTYLAYAAAKRGNRSAVVYAFSYLALLLGLGLNSILLFVPGIDLALTSLAPEWALSLKLYTYQIGAALEILLMSFANSAVIQEISGERTNALKLARDKSEEISQLKAEFNRQIEQELKGCSAELQAKNAELERRETIKSRFFSYISHELRSPLTLIRGQLNILGEQEGAQKGSYDREAIQNSVQQTHRLESMLDKLLQLSQLEADQLRLSVEETELGAWITTQVDAFQHLASAQGLTLQVNIPADPVLIYIDIDKLQTILTNLIGNAIKHTSGRGFIEVGVSMPDDCTKDSMVEPFACLTVSDTGCGIAAEVLPHIFDRYYQSDHQSTGYGIGLALAKELTELHGGAIEVSSELGQGTCFTVQIPIGKAHLKADEVRVHKWANESQPKDHSTTDLPSRSSATILYAEDNVELRRFVADQLKKDYDIIEAKDGKEALELARSVSPDLIVSDVLMSGGDGLDLLAALRSEPSLRGIPVILLSALTSVESRLKGLESWADDYLGKPFEIKELSLRIRNLLDRLPRSSGRAQIADGDGIDPKEPQIPEHQIEFARDLKNAVTKHIDDLDFDVKGLAKALGMSEATLRRRTQQIVHETPADYIRAIRLQTANEHIRKGSFATVSELAYAVGFRSRGYFSKLYQKRYGEMPSSLLREQ